MKLTQLKKVSVTKVKNTPSYRVTINKAWAEAVGISEENRNILISMENGSITITGGIDENGEKI